MNLFDGAIFILCFTVLVTSICPHGYQEAEPEPTWSKDQQIADPANPNDTIILFFKEFIFKELNIVENSNCNTYEKVPKHLLQAFQTRVDPRNQFLPEILRAKEFPVKMGKSGLTYLHFSCKKLLFINVNHVIVDVYLPHPKTAQNDIRIFSNSRGVNFTNIQNRVEEDGEWLVVYFKMYYFDIEIEQNIDIIIGIDEDNFDNLTQTKSAGAIVHVRSPEEPYNLIEQRHLCDESSCCPVKMDVDFDKLGWGKLILRPKVFKLSFCAGICESAPSHYTFHSSILMRMIHTYKDKAPKTSLCCAPHELYSYSILFRDHDGMIHNKLIPEVEVKSCICT